jgi:ammonium transporter, Amt family
MLFAFPLLLVIMIKGRRICMQKNTGILFFLLAVVGSPVNAFAQTSAKIDSGDTAFVLLSAALVMLMTPGLAMFYGGMVRRKNVLGTIMHSFVAIALVSVQWVLIGYSLSFGPDISGLIGNLAWIGLRGVGIDPNPDYAATVPHIAFMIYQAMFAVITPALIAGAFAERMKFSAFLVFTLVWTTIVYDPVAHWVWGTGGWLKNMGALDFAGGIVVHITSGISALAAALVIGGRKGFLREPMPPHNLPMTVLGAGLLWFGWFGFNAGSALSSGGLSAMAFVATHIAAVSATLIWVIIEWLHRGKPTMFGAATGSIAGLATITPASGFVGPMPAFVIGLLAGAVCYVSLNMKAKLGYDGFARCLRRPRCRRHFRDPRRGVFRGKADQSCRRRRAVLREPASTACPGYGDCGCCCLFIWHKSSTAEADRLDHRSAGH